MNLSRCPFCGGYAEWYVEGYTTTPWCVRCKKCTCRLLHFGSPDLAATGWNDRHSTEAIVGRRLVDITGDLFEQKADAICLTTNGIVKDNGRAVMGRGCALQAKQRWENIDRRLGDLIQKNGNCCQMIFHNADHEFQYAVVAFPVKHDWRDNADLSMIRRSALQLMEMVEKHGWRRVILPKPGCGSGKLPWHEVRKVLLPILDERVAVISTKNSVDSQQVFR